MFTFKEVQLFASYVSLAVYGLFIHRVYYIYISIYFSGVYIWYWSKLCGVAKAIGFMIFKIYSKKSYLVAAIWCDILALAARLFSAVT